MVIFSSASHCVLLWPPYMLTLSDDEAELTFYHCNLLWTMPKKKKTSLQLSSLPLELFCFFLAVCVCHPFGLHEGGCEKSGVQLKGRDWNERLFEWHLGLLGWKESAFRVGFLWKSRVPASSALDGRFIALKVFKMAASDEKKRQMVTTCTSHLWKLRTVI